MTVIALTSGMGTGVKYVAEQVARRLGFELVYREICPAGLESVPINPPRKESRWETGLAWLTAARQLDGLKELEELYRVAQRGNVLICGATPLHFLGEVANVTKIRVRTTMAVRVRRIMACMGTDEPDMALGKILQSDRRQAEALKCMFGINDFESPQLYDSVVDTGREPAETCAMQIAKLALQPISITAPAPWIIFEKMIEQIRLARENRNELAKGGCAESLNRSS
jgi:Cytidylate kinase-like family